LVDGIHLGQAAPGGIGLNSFACEKNHKFELAGIFTGG